MKSYEIPLKITPVRQKFVWDREKELDRIYRINKDYQDIFKPSFLSC